MLFCFYPWVNPPTFPCPTNKALVGTEWAILFSLAQMGTKQSSAFFYMGGHWLRGMALESLLMSHKSVQDGLSQKMDPPKRFPLKVFGPPGPCPEHMMM